MIPDNTNNSNTAATADDSLADSFLDLDSIKDYFLDDVFPDFTNIMSNSLHPKTHQKSCLESQNAIFPTGVCESSCPEGKVDVLPTGVCEKSRLEGKFDVLQSGVCEKSCLEGEVDVLASECCDKVCKGEVLASEDVGGVCEGGEAVSSAVEDGRVEKMEGVIEEELKKVSLSGVELSELKTEAVSAKEEEEESEGSSESESESGSSSSESETSSSDSSDDEEEQGGVEGKKGVNMDEDVEEGEIMEKGSQNEDAENSDEDVEEMVMWSDIDDEEDGAGGKVSEPIKSKNEAKELPPVPPINVTLEPHHQLLPVGVVLSVLGAQVIVEGVEKHNPLNEASILWITESRSPLGLIDEIFGPVKNPYYVVRYNSETEIPPGIVQGTSISYVQEFADYVLNDKSLYKKGYDASGENDEELSEEAEFSDDEKEAEYRRMQKMSKRRMNDQKPANKKNNKKVRDKDMSWKNGKPPTNQAPPNVGQSQQRHNQQYPSGGQLVNYSNNPPLPAMGHMLAGGNGMLPTFPQVSQSIGFLPQSSGVYTNAAMPYQQPQNPVLPNVFPTNGNQWLTQTNMQHPYQMPLLSGFPNAFNQQFNLNQGPIPTHALPGGPANFIPAPIGGQMSPWAGAMNLNGLNQPTFGMGMQPQHNLPSINAQQPGMQPPTVFPGNTGGSQNFNMGSSFDDRRKPPRRGAGHFRGHGGPRPSR